MTPTDTRNINFDSTQYDSSSGPTITGKGPTLVMPKTPNPEVSSRGLEIAKRGTNKRKQNIDPDALKRLQETLDSYEEKAETNEEFRSILSSLR